MEWWAAAIDALSRPLRWRLVFFADRDSLGTIRPDRLEVVRPMLDPRNQPIVACNTFPGQRCWRFDEPLTEMNHRAMGV
jgi:hypothetical protein